MILFYGQHLPYIPFLKNTTVSQLSDLIYSNNMEEPKGNDGLVQVMNTKPPFVTVVSTVRFSSLVF